MTAKAPTPGSYPVKPPRGKRAPKIAAPGATRITLRGIMAVPDDFGRVRVLFVDRLPDGSLDFSADILQRAIPANKYMSVPYRIAAPSSAQGLTSSWIDDDTLGEFWVVLPQRYAKHWAGVAADLRGLPVSVEATLRPFTIMSAEGDEMINNGVSLDVSTITALPRAT